LGMLRPTSGTAQIGGFDCTHDSLRVRQLTAYLPGEPQLFRSMRGAEVLDFFAAVRPHRSPAAYRQVAARLDLDLSRRVSAMSTGMRQKLALAVTLAADTELVILDEPTANLDPTVRAEVLQMVREARERKRTVMFSSHVLSEVEETCDRVAILRAGELVHVQWMAEIRRCHRVHVWFREPVETPLHDYEGACRTIRQRDRELTVESGDDLAPLLSWLARYPLEDVRVEQVGLRPVYDRFHGSAHFEPTSL
ncbi:MAG: ABC transporter ATP-binding protein, partial [Pirellulaceae bacterium]